MPPKSEPVKKEGGTTTNTNTNDNALKPTFVPKVPVRRKKVEVQEESNDILSGPQSRPARVTERPKRERQEAAPIKVAFQAPARSTAPTRRAAHIPHTTFSSFDSSMNSEDGKKYVALVPPQPLPFDVEETVKPWYDGWSSVDPVGLPAYRDASLPSVIADLKALADEQESMTESDYARIAQKNQETRLAVERGEYPPLDGTGGVLPFQSTSSWFYPPLSVKVEEMRKAKNEAEQVKMEDQDNTHAESAPNTEVPLDMNQDQIMLFQLPSHLPVFPKSDNSSTTSSSHNSMTSPTTSTTSTGSLSAHMSDTFISNTSTSNLSSSAPASSSANVYETALLHDEPMIIDDSSRSGVTTTELARQYKVFNTHDGNSIKNIEAGRVGELVVYKSGKVKMKIGNIMYDVSAGVHTPFRQDLVAITQNTNAKGELRDPQFPFKMNNLGVIKNHVIVSLDVDNLLKQKNTYVPPQEATETYE